MSTTTIRVAETTRDLANELAQDTGESTAAVVAEGLELLRKQRFWRQWQEGWRQLAEDPEARSEYEAEHAEWAATDVDIADADEDEDEDWAYLLDTTRGQHGGSAR